MASTSLGASMGFLARTATFTTGDTEKAIDLNGCASAAVDTVPHLSR